MTLAQEMILDVDRLLMDRNDFAVNIAYTKVGTTDDLRPIPAQVYPVIDEQTNKALKSVATLLISKTNIDVATAGDTGEIFGGRKFRVVEVMEGGPGAWSVRVELGGAASE